jgi:hypothetical protein
MIPRRIALVLAVILHTLGCVAARAEAPPTFQNDVMAVLSKLGCNSGTCHGNLNGKGGFKLSLRGEDPAADYLALTRDQMGRRVDPLDPAQSLLLLKATAAIPHEGGKRTSPDSPEHRVLGQWIDAGASRDSQATPRAVKLVVEPGRVVATEPTDRVQLKATVEYSDGTNRDVTWLACYEPTGVNIEATAGGLIKRKKPGESSVLVRYLHLQQTVRVAFIPDRPGFVFRAPPAANRIDELVFAKLQSLRMNPSPVCDDTTFMRRAYLDLTGLPPTAQEARRFAADTSADKRAKLVDELLDRPEFADFWAVKWADLLRVEEKVLDKKGVEVFHGWVRQAMADNLPMDRFARQILSATGSTYKNPPANFYRALRDPTARTEAVAQVFLGTRMQCARCHNHPFERWTMDDYYGLSAMFAKIDYKIVENKRTDKNDKHQFIGEQIVELTGKAPVIHPRTNQPAPPRYLGAAAEDIPEKDNRLNQLARWVTSPDNPLFARSMVNRIWAHLMGRGIVDPVDDLRASNPPSNPELLQELARSFIRGGFDQKQLIRAIMKSTVYQLDWRGNDTNAEDEANFSRGVVRRLTAEQLLDSIAALTGVPPAFEGYDQPIRAAQVRGVIQVGRKANATPGDRFLKTFGKPPRLLNCECERVNQTALSQVIELTSGPAISDALRATDNRLADLLKSHDSPSRLIEELYWAAVSRAPTAEETESMTRHLEQAPDRRAGLEDVAWALINSKEFLLRR